MSNSEMPLSDEVAYFTGGIDSLDTLALLFDYNY